MLRADGQTWRLPRPASPGRFGFVAAVAVSLSLAVPSGAGAAVTVGSDLGQSANAGSGCVAEPCTLASLTIPGRQTASPIDGVVTRWRIRGPASPGMLALRVIRPSGAGTYGGAGASSTEPINSASDLQTFSTQLPIAAGDFIGIDVPFGAQDPSGMLVATAGATRSHFEPALADSGRASAPLVQVPNSELLVNADVEPDADCDGRGDETQDPAVSGGCLSPPPDGSPPPASPSNEFSFGKLRPNKRKGTAKLTVIVPGPGELELAKNKKLKPKDKRAGTEGETALAIKPKRKAKKKLKRKGKAKVKTEVTYTPDGGSPNTQTKKVKLKKRR